MPLYLLHGFRWPREAIRIFIILSNLEDATADYIQTPASVIALRAEIFRQYPRLKKTCPNLTFVEQHDPEDLHTGSQPYAFVADTVRIAATPAKGSLKDGPTAGEGDTGTLRGLSIDVGEAMGKGVGVGGETWDAIADLRDELSKEAAVGWFAVWNGDVERKDVGLKKGEKAGSDGEETEEEDEAAKSSAAPTNTGQTAAQWNGGSQANGTKSSPVDGGEGGGGNGKRQGSAASDIQLQISTVDGATTSSTATATAVTTATAAGAGTVGAGVAAARSGPSASRNHRPATSERGGVGGLKRLFSRGRLSNR